MKFIVDNQTTRVVIGGKDNLKGNLKQELRDYLTIPIKNTFFIEKHLREKGFKGKISKTKCFVTENFEFPTGFLPNVVDFLNDFGVNMEVEDIRNNLPTFSNIHTTTPEFDLYPHQIDLITSVNNTLKIGNTDLYFPRGIWRAATNSGKTAAAGCLVKSVTNPNALFLIDSQDLFEQHIAYYESVFGKVGKIGKVGSKYIYEPARPFTIAMIGTLSSRMEKDIAIKVALNRDYNIVLVDECHYASSGEGALLLQGINAGMRVFMSGTPLNNSDPFANYRIIGMSGAVLKNISKRFLIDNGFSMEPAVRMYLNPETASGVNYKEEYARVISRSQKRADFIADLIAKRTQRKVLITFFEKAHGYLMYDAFITKYPELAEGTAWVHGSDKRRSEKIRDYKSGKIKRLFTSTIFQQGINVKDIQTIIYGQAEKEVIALSQFMGRGERLDGVDKIFEWIDFWDMGKHVSPHSAKRVKFYQKENLDIRYMNYEATVAGRPKHK